MRPFLYGFKPFQYPPGAFKVRYRLKRHPNCHVIGFLEETDTHYVVTDVCNGGTTRVHKSRVTAVTPMASNRAA